MSSFPPFKCYFCNREILMNFWCDRCRGDVDTYHKSTGNARGIVCIYECSFCEARIPTTGVLTPHDFNTISSSTPSE